MGYKFEVSERSLGKHDGNNKQRIASGIPHVRLSEALGDIWKKKVSFVEDD